MLSAPTSASAAALAGTDTETGGVEMTQPVAEPGSAEPGSAQTAAEPPRGPTRSSGGSAMLAALEASLVEILGASSGRTAASAVSSTSAQETEDPRGAALLDAAFGLPTDPMLFLLQLSERLGMQSTRSDRAGVELNRNLQADAAERRREAMAAAHRASRRAERWASHLPKWVGKLVKGITVAAALAGAACTGGAALGLALAGAVLMFGAKGIQKTAIRLGMDPERAAYLGIACRIAGAALMVTSGGIGGATAGAGSTGASTLANAAETASRVKQVVQATLEVASGTRQIGAAVNGARAERSEIQADGESLRSEASELRMREVLESMQQSLQSLNDFREKVLAMNQVENRRAMETAAAIGR